MLRDLAKIMMVALTIGLAPLAAAQPGERFLVAETAPGDASSDIIAAAAATGQFTQFLAALERAGFEETLRGEGPFTIFAPTDEAFRRMGQREVERLMQGEAHEELLALLAYHVVPERVTSADLRGRVVCQETATGHLVTLDGRDGLRVNDELVVIPDIEAANGVIHGINAVLQADVLVANAR